MGGSDYARRDLEEDLFEEDLEALPTAPLRAPTLTLADKPAAAPATSRFAVPAAVRKVAARAARVSPAVVFSSPAQLPPPAPAPSAKPAVSVGIGESGCLCTMPPLLAAQGVVDAVVRFSDGRVVRYSSRFRPPR